MILRNHPIIWMSEESKWSMSKSENPSPDIPQKNAKRRAEKLASSSPSLHPLLERERERERGIVQL